jgi:hypothetical protein
MAKKPTAAPARISVLDRRLQHPFGSPSRDIPLTGEKSGWAVRTFCADAEHPNRHYDAVHRLGWTPVTPDDLAVSVESLGFVVSADRRVVRGPQGQEVLMAMPADMFAKIQRRKAEMNDKSLKPSNVREEVSHATALAHGDQAGSMIHNHFSQQDTVETVEG